MNRLLLAVLLMFIAVPAVAAEWEAQWTYDHTINDLAGFKLYHGDVELVTLPPAARVYGFTFESAGVDTFTLKAFDLAGQESEGVSYTLDPPPPAPTGFIILRKE